MTHQEMIDVITHHMNGGKIYCRGKNSNTRWTYCGDPRWDFYEFEYKVETVKTVDDMEPGDSATILNTEYWKGARIAKINDGRIMLIEEWDKCEERPSYKPYKTIWTYNPSNFQVEID